MIGPGLVNAGEVTTQPGATETETSDVSTDTGSVAPEKTEQAGESQDNAEGSSEQGNDQRFRPRTKLDTIKELRSRLREERASRETEMGSLRSQLDEMKALIQSRNQGPKPSKTFWEAPEEVLQERVREQLTELKKELLENFNQSRTADQQTSEWKQETSEATEFIRSQKTVTPEDEEDIADIVRNTRPALRDSMRPMERAEYALLKWQQARGIGDKSALKAKAAGVQGAPPAAPGRKTWTDAEVERELSKFPKDPKDWSPEQHKAFDALDREIREATAEGRVK